MSRNIWRRIWKNEMSKDDLSWKEQSLTNCTKTESTQFWQKRSGAKMWWKVLVLYLITELPYWLYLNPWALLFKVGFFGRVQFWSIFTKICLFLLYLLECVKFGKMYHSALVGVVFKNGAQFNLMQFCKTLKDIKSLAHNETGPN